MESWFILSLSFLLLISSSVCQNPFVCINGETSCIRGTTISANGSDEAFEVFYGIPYAQPPIGNLRFANPVPTNHWLGIIDAIEPKPECIQKFIVFPNESVIGVEDCLYINVYRPTGVPATSRLPVIVWIHGGGFFGGKATQDGPQLFLNTKEVIWVSMAYRLGALGFLSTGDEHSPGNYGLKDQSLALKWVRDHIDAFGGNASSITLMGVSAGGAAVHMHMMSPLSQGLFDRAIVMSGSALAPYSQPVSDPLAQAMQQGRLLGIDAVNSQELIARLRTVSAHDLVDSIEGMKHWDLDPLTTFKTAIEANVTGAFMIEHPMDISINGNYPHMPWVTGVVEHEGAVRAASIVTNPVLVSDLNTQFDTLLPFLMEIEIRDEANEAEIVQKIKDKYLNGSNVITAENDQRLIDMYSDRAFLYPYYKMTAHYANYVNSSQLPIYLYRFMFRGPYSYSTYITRTDRDFGVIHLDDTLYMFRSNLPQLPNLPLYNNVTRNLIDFYVSFAKTGHPAVLSEQGFIGECTSSTFPNQQFCDYQEFVNSADGNSVEIHTRNGFNEDMILFWDEIFELAERSGTSRIRLSITACILMFGVYLKSLLCCRK